MTTETVLTMLADHLGQTPFAQRAEVEPEPPRIKVYRIWITPATLSKFPLPVEAFSLAEALELARKAARHLPQVGNRPFDVSGREA